MGEVGSAIDGVDLDAIRSYLEDTPVEYAVLFGSCIRATADESSDVDIALRFPDEMDKRERFDLRNRIDADLQSYAERFVDVSDVKSLPTGVAHRALRTGTLLFGNEELADADRERLDREHEATRSERDEARQSFVERLAEGEFR
jgi:predicted nucleotidyltransferase